MPVAVHVGLEKYCTRDVFQGVSGDSEGFKEVEKV